MKNGFKLFELNGCPIYIKYWFFILFLFVQTNIVVSLFLAVLIHEIAHSVMAKRLGYLTESIVIDIFYGAAYIDSKFNDNHNDTIKIAFAGPISNILTGFFSIGLCIFLTSPLLDFMVMFIIINFFIGIFNLIPIYPLDGGRISKSLLSKSFGNKKGKYLNGIISLSLSTGILIYALISFDIMLIVSSVLFMFLSWHEIKDTPTTNFE